MLITLEFSFIKTGGLEEGFEEIRKEWHHIGVMDGGPRHEGDTRKDVV